MVNLVFGDGVNVLTEGNNCVRGGVKGLRFGLDDSIDYRLMIIGRDYFVMRVRFKYSQYYYTTAF